jgi:hypothetical protein
MVTLNRGLIMNNLTKSMLTRGDNLAVCKGQLIITPKSGQIVPKDWLSVNSHKIVSEIAEQLNHSIFTYSYYKTGVYNSGLFPGVMIRFIDLLKYDEAYAVFNANLKRQRASRNKKVGDLLPEGHFYSGKRSAFCLLWFRTNLPIPRRFSEWHKSMSKLQYVYFVANKSSNDKLSNQSIKPLSLDANEIARLFSDNSGTSQRQASDNLVTRNGGKQLRQEMVARNGDKDIATGHTNSVQTQNSNYVTNKVRVLESARELNACVSNRVLSNKVMTCEVVSIPPNNKVPEEQSNDEWLQDYDSAD